MPALTSLAFHHKTGVSLRQNIPFAIELYDRAASYGYAMAQYNLGICYAHGEGTEKNDSKAIECITKAAMQNDPHAQHELGCMYLRGEGIFFRC